MRKKAARKSSGSSSGRMDSSRDPVLQSLFQEEVDRMVLANGLTLVVKPDFGAEVVSLQAWVKTGSIHEGDFMGSGLSHYLEHMVFKGSDKRSASQFAREVHSLGGYVNAYTSFDRTVYYLDVPSESTRQALELLGDLVLNARLPREDAIRERDVILREIDMGMDDPDRRVSQALFSAAFRRHPYRHPVIGHREIFERLSPEDLENYYRRRYVPENLVLIVAGAVEPEAFREEVEAVFGGFPRFRSPEPYIPQEPVQMAGRVLRMEGDVQVFRGYLSWKIPGLGHRDAPALDMLAQIVGGGESSLLWQEMREKRRLVHDIDAVAWTPGDMGLFLVSYLAEPGKGMEAENAIVERLHGLGPKDVTEQRLEKSRRQAIMGEVNSRKTMKGQAARLGVAEVVVGDLGYARTYLSRLDRLRPEDIASLIPEYLVDNSETKVCLAPKASQPRRSAGSRTDRHPGDFQEWTLDNGTHLLIQRDPRLPKLHLRAAMRGGPLYEENGIRGASALLATLLTRDTASYSAEEVAERIERVGGSFRSFCGNNTFGFGLEVLASDKPLVLEMLEQALLHPAFQRETVRTERESQIAQLREEDDDVVAFGRRELRKRFFGGHPYSHDHLGALEALEKISRETIRKQYSRLLRGGNLVVAASGDMEPEALAAELRPLLEGVPGRPFDRISRPLQHPAEVGRVELRRDREQAIVLRAFPDVGVTDPRTVKAELLDELFSGMSSRLFERVREEKGLAYFVGAYRVVGMDTGMFTLYAGTHPDHVEAVYSEMDLEIQRILKGDFEESELQRCRTRLKAQKRMGMETAGARALQAALNCLYGLPVDDWKSYPERIDAVGPEELREFASELLVPAHSLELVVRP